MKGIRELCGILGYLAHSLDGEWNFWGIWNDTCRFGDVIDVLKKNMTGTLFDTVGVIE